MLSMERNGKQLIALALVAGELLSIVLPLAAQEAGLVILDSNLSSVNLSQAYSYRLRATGGNAPYQWSVVSGTLPGGLSLDEDSGLLSGIPNTTGNVVFTVQVQDAEGRIDTRRYAVTVLTSGFQLEADAKTVNLVQGRTVAVGLRVLGSAPTSNPIGFSLVSALPTSVVGSFQPVLVAGGSTTLAFAAERSAVPGTYPLRISAVSGSYTQYLDLSLAVKLPEPQFFGFAPPGGVIGTRVELRGADLDNVRTVNFNRVNARFTRIDNTHLSAIVPAGATTGRIGITTAGGTVTSVEDFVVPRYTIAVTPQPAVGSGARFSIALGGTTDALLDLSVRGLPEGVDGIFDPDYLGGEVRTSRLTLASEALAPGDYPFEVIAGLVSTSITLQIRLPAPRLSRLAPLRGAPGTTFVLQGQFFQDGARLSINHQSLAVVSITPTQVVGRIVPGTTSGRLTLTNPDGQSSSTSSVFTVLSDRQKPPAVPSQPPL